MTLRYLTAGESHGPGLTTILEGLPSNFTILQEHIDFELKRRQLGYGRGGRMKIESDSAQITAGIRHGKTLGSPVSLWIENKNFQAWTKEMSIHPIEGFESKKAVHHPRPGHADLNGALKYNHRDMRNILERASARETTARVAVGAICKQFLRQFNIEIAGHVIELAGVKIDEARPSFEDIQKLQEDDECRCIQKDVSEKMKARIDEAKKAGDSAGGVFEILVKGCPAGLGSHVQWDRKLDARLSYAIMSIQAIKGVEVGMGFNVGTVLGSQVHDGIYFDSDNNAYKRRTNNAGGFEGGMTTGEIIVLKGAMKPISTLYTPLESVDVESKETVKASVERSDTCAVPAASVIAENVVAFEIARSFLEKFGGDSLEEIQSNYTNYQKYLENF